MKTSISINPLTMITQNSLLALMALFNMILGALGVCSILVGIYFLIVENSLKGVSKHAETMLPWLVLAYGMWVLVIGMANFQFFSSPFCPYAFSLSMIIAMSAGLGLLIVTFNYKNDYDYSYMEGLQFHIDHYKEEYPPLMDEIQYKMKCCGIEGPKDWLKSPFGQVPSSCCKSRMCNPENKDEIFTEGCHKVLASAMRGPVLWTQAVSLVATFIPLLGCFCCFLQSAAAATEKYEEIMME